MTTEQTTCDSCGDELTATGNHAEYRLRLTLEERPHAGGTKVDLVPFVPIDRDHCFCDLACLHHWMTAKQSSQPVV